MFFSAESSSPPPASRPPVLQAVGNTPLLPLRFGPENVTIHAKAEFLNPSGSIKDRLARAVFDELHRLGRIGPDHTVLEVSSGNTGIALAMAGAVTRTRIHILMSDTASWERQQLIRHFGAQLTLFRANQGYLTGIALAEQMAANDPRIFLPRQFENPAHARDHVRHTAPEILRQIPDGRVDAFVSGYGTGGTLAGCGQALRRANRDVMLVAMEADSGPLPAGEMPCCELIEGLAGGFLPPLMRSVRIDSTIKVSSADALAMARRLARQFGLPVGPSSGANVCAALRIADLLGPRRHVVTILCDRAERYLSTNLFDVELPE